MRPATRGVVHGGREREVARGQAVPAPQQHLAGREIEPGAAHVLAAAARPSSITTRVAVAARVLLDHDRVGAVRHDAAGEDAHGFAAPDRARSNGRPAATSPITVSRAGARATSAARTA